MSYAFDRRRYWKERARKIAKFAAGRHLHSSGARVGPPPRRRVPTVFVSAAALFGASRSGGGEAGKQARARVKDARGPPRRRASLMPGDRPQGTILYAEDDAVVRLAVAETLAAEGWRVEACADGLSALARLEGGARYDLLLFDNSMPGVCGLELVRRARELGHRRGLPVVVLSAGDCGREARRAGADVFLRKPEDLPALADALGRLLEAGYSRS